MDSHDQQQRSAADKRLARSIIQYICNGENEVPLCTVEARLCRCEGCASFRGDFCLDYPKGYAAALVGLEGAVCDKWAGI